MEMVHVDSSMLSSIGYDAETKELEVVFTSGRVWRYCGVPREVYDELLASDSKGSYMNSCIIHEYQDYPVTRRTSRRMR